LNRWTHRLKKDFNFGFISSCLCADVWDVWDVWDVNQSSDEEERRTFLGFFWLPKKLAEDVEINRFILFKE
jgi:hypothetical protein